MGEICLQSYHLPSLLAHPAAAPQHSCHATCSRPANCTQQHTHCTAAVEMTFEPCCPMSTSNLQPHLQQRGQIRLEFAPEDHDGKVRQQCNGWRAQQCCQPKHRTASTNAMQQACTCCMTAMSRQTYSFGIANSATAVVPAVVPLLTHAVLAQHHAPPSLTTSNTHSYTKPPKLCLHTACMHACIHPSIR